MARRWLLLFLLFVVGRVGAVSDISTSGKFTLEGRYFTDVAAFPGQYGSSNLSATLEPVFEWEDDSGDNLFRFAPYLRLDQHDSHRTHGDIRDLSWIHIGEDWELRTGIRTLFWGVTEFQHLVDIINQTDQVDDIDGEAKLGQPMLNLSLVRDWGIVDLFVLPGFRERTYPGNAGRLRSPLPVDNHLTTYQSDGKAGNVDYALRWSHTLDALDIGAYWFHGTSREPDLIPTLNSAGAPVLQADYPIITQYGLDLQATLDDWLWKLEVIRQQRPGSHYSAAQGGFEYTFVGVADSSSDVGILLEYGWDERGRNAGSPFQNDLFLGTRIALNDAESTEILAGVSYDLNYHSRGVLVEAIRRFSDRLKLNLDLHLFQNSVADPVFNSLAEDNYLQLTAEYYF